MKKTQRWLCLLLVACMMLSILPVVAMAVEPPKVLYRENFDAVSAEGMGDGWSLIEMKEGKALSGTSSPEGSLLKVLPVENLPKEYTIVADVAVLKKLGQWWPSASVVFQYADESSFHHFSMKPIYTNLWAEFFQWQNGKETQLADGKNCANFADPQNMRLRVTVSPSEINYYVDGRNVATCENKGAAGTRVGLRVSRAEALFDNLIIYEGVVEPAVGNEKGEIVLTPDPTIWNNEDVFYSEPSGAWSSVSQKGWDDSDVRTASSGSAVWNAYSPLYSYSSASSGNFKLEYYLPTEDCAEISVTVNTVHGMWKYTIPAKSPIGWKELGVVTASKGTVFKVTASSNGQIYADAVRMTPTGDQADAVYTPTGGASTETAILVNQIGYDNGTAMRASCLNVADGTEFLVINRKTGEFAYTGQVENGIADFTGKIDAAEDTDFYISCAGKESYDFTIGTNVIQRRSVKNALAFMNEVRSDGFKRYSTDGAARNGTAIAWRDSHQFSFELNGLVMQYMANPSVYDNMPHSIVGLDQCDYPELRTQNEPDIIWLIKFAARRYYDIGTNTKEKLHMLTKEQLAYYLYLAPELIARGWETEAFYQKVRDFTISVWGDKTATVQWYAVKGTDHDLYSVQSVFGGLKGQQPMGHSIVPNLLMYEVAKRDGLSETQQNRFLDAAIKNCEYTISNNDGNDICDPFYCKGQRMSEYITVPALGYFIEMCPGQETLKAQVKAKIAEWAEVNIARGDNLWDIRKAVSKAAGDLEKYKFHNPNFTDAQKTITKEYWTGAAYATDDNQTAYLGGEVPKNEPGNQAGLQAITYAAARVLDDVPTKERLYALGVAAIDDLFGRNPSGRAAFYHFVRDFKGGDLGWYTQPDGGYGMLSGCTGVIDGNAPEACYPYNPDAYASGYTEGWVAYNTAWNASLAYSQAENVELDVDTANGTNVGAIVTVTLTAPINMDTETAETGTVWVTNEATGERTAVTVKEDGVSNTTFKGSFDLPNAQTVTVSYGSGLFAHTQTITVEGYQEVKTTALTLKADKTKAEAGETVKLTVEFTPENTTDKTVDFTSSNTDVATVDANGNVTLLAAGKVTITAALRSNPSIFNSVELTVEEAEQPLMPITKLDELYKKVYTDANGNLNYRMYVPADYNSSKTYPVLIYLNGAGSRGTDNAGQLRNLSPLITPLIGDTKHECSHEF